MFCWHYHDLRNHFVFYSAYSRYFFTPRWCPTREEESGPLPKVARVQPRYIVHRNAEYMQTHQTSTIISVLFLNSLPRVFCQCTERCHAGTHHAHYEGTGTCKASCSSSDVIIKADCDMIQLILIVHIQKEN